MSALSQEHAALLRRYAAEAEQRGELPPEVLALIYREQWFRSLVPKRFGGLELPLPAVVRLEEEIAGADGSTGWVVTLCSGAGWFSGFFSSARLERLFLNPRMCVAGSGSPDGRADRLEGGGYRITGRWGYASGARHATAFTANCVVWEAGAPVLGEDGQRLVRPFLFLREEVEVAEDWKAVGLGATGSHGFSVTGLGVPAERVFDIDVAAAADDSPLYRYPFLPLAQATLAVNCSGMALHFFDCFDKLFLARMERGHLSAAAAAWVKELFAQASKSMADIRAIFYKALDASWVIASIEGAQPETDPYPIVGQHSRLLASTALHWVDKLYPLAGLGAARADTEINRVWRDLHTASQHPLLVFGM